MSGLGSGAISPVSARYAAQLKELLQAQTAQRTAAAEAAASAARAEPATSVQDTAAVRASAASAEPARADAAASADRVGQTQPMDPAVETVAPAAPEISTVGTFVNIEV